MKIIIDTREQCPLMFRLSETVEGVIIRKLDVGDYSIEGHEDQIAIERKSPGDLFHTLGKDHKRFQAEIDRAKAKNMKYFGIVVEASYTSVINKMFEGSSYIQMQGDAICAIAYTLKLKYGVDVIFCNNRSEATGIIKNIFRSYMKLHGGKK